MKKNLNILVFFLILNLFLFIQGISCSFAYEHKTKQVLVLHSYHQSHTWTDNIMRGIKTVFDSSSFDIMFHIEYMDTKRHHFQESFSQLSALYEFRYCDINFDVIIISDNNALDFLLARRDKLFPDVPVVFCGINGFTDSMISGHEEITGVVEAIDIKSTLEIALHLYPNTEQIAVISDRTPTGLNLSKQMLQVMPDFTDIVQFIELIDLTAQELQESLRQLPENTLIIPLVFFQDSAGMKFSDKEFIPLIADSNNLPLFSMWEHYMGLGVMGGMVTNGELQGNRAAEKAVRILQGESADNIPVLRKSPNAMMFDYAQIKRFGISLSQLPSDSILINKPFSFYGTYKILIWEVTAVFILLISLIFGLFINMLKRKQVEKELRLHREHLEEVVKLRTSELTDANENLQASEEAFRQFFDNVPEVVLMQNISDGSVIHISRAYEKLFGQSIEKVMENPSVFADVLHPDDRERLLQIFQEQTGNDAAGIGYQTEYRVIHPDGSIRWIDSQGFPICDQSGIPYRLAIVARDITKRKRAEKALRESEEKFRMLFNNAPVLIDGFDENGRCVLWNKECEKVFGWTLEEINSHENPLELFYPEPEVQKEVLKSVSLSPEIKFKEWRPVTKNREERITLWANFQIPNGMIINIGHDITELKKAEIELKQAKEAAEAANRAKSTFLANMSHELRTPLNSILGFSQLMSHDKSLKPEQKKNLGTIRRSGEYLLKLINQVLDLSKIESGRTTLDESNFDLYNLLNETEEMFRLKTKNKGLELLFQHSPDVPRYIKTDKPKLQQILINLIGNAVKFTEKGKICLSISRKHLPEQKKLFTDNCSLTTDNCLLFTLKDSGPGIAADELNDLFKPFVKTKTGRESHKGTGLGLSISRKFIQMMGGEIKVESESGQGTTFIFHIKAGTAHADEIETEKPGRRVIAQEANQPCYRILIADDNEYNRLLFTNILNPFNFELREAQNGQEAVEIWKNWQPHLIWMDILMPVMDGKKAAKKIRNYESISKNLIPHTIIIAVTASAFKDDRISIMASGCDDFLSKPFYEADIFELMKKHLDLSFIYEENIENNSSIDEDINKAVLDSKRLKTLPKDWLDSLKNAAVRTDPKGTKAAIQKIREKDETLADALARLVKKYRFDIIQNLFEEN